MKKEEIVRKNIAETFDFVRYLMDTPDALDDLPNGSTIDFLQSNEEIATPQSGRAKRKAKDIVAKTAGICKGINAAMEAKRLRQSWERNVWK
jgi:hypothetical protein